MALSSSALFLLVHGTNVLKLDEFPQEIGWDDKDVPITASWQSNSSDELILRARLQVSLSLYG